MPASDVCVKQTLDTEESIHIADGKVAEGGNYIVNPYDEYALEEAIRIKEASYKILQAKKQVLTEHFN